MRKTMHMKRRGGLGIAIAAILSLAGGLLPAGRAGAVDFNRKPACSDGVDNDNDGKCDYAGCRINNVDLPADPGCVGINDDDESDLNFTPQIKARIAIVFDTSGSTLWNVCCSSFGNGGNNPYTGGDGSAECPGNDVACGSNTPDCNGHANQCSSATCGNSTADDSRLYKLKKGLTGAVAAYGEVEWSLFRFHQTAKSFSCPTNGGGIGQDGGWQGAGSTDNNGTNTCASGKPFANADQLVKFAPDSTEYILGWMDNRSNWNGSGSAPSGQDFELRGDGYTPLAGSLNSVRTTLAAIKAADPEGSCRPYRVILVTDGEESCGGDAPAAAAALKNAGIPVYVVGFADAAAAADLNDIANSGGTNKAYFADEPDSLSAAITDIVSKTVLIEKCDGVDNNCNNQVDEGFNAGDNCDNGQKGVCFRTGKYICTANGLGTTCNAPHINPGNELDHGCNGLDDDCDGVIDNGLTCSGCGPEICNGRDDDCDGTADNGSMPGVGDVCGIDVGECQTGHLICSAGHLVCSGNSGPSTEVCDGKDNDCDGVVDNITRECYDFPTGCMNVSSDVNNPHFECMGRCIPGFQTCTIQTEPGFGTCTGELGPQQELCNGVDDNCDGNVDEDFPMLGQECERGQGLCHTTGHYICSPDGTGVVCDAIVVAGVPESCNGVDDDCDGVVDNFPAGEPPPAPIGQACGSCGGTYACMNGQVVCQGGAAQPEVCNGKDDNCDGLIDNPPPGGTLPGTGATCVPDDPLHPGTPLFTVTGSCKAGHTECVAGGIVCLGYTGPQPETCNGIDDNCDGVVDNGATCPDQADMCIAGHCASPCGGGEFPCPFGEVCKDEGGSRVCEPDPCVGVTCPNGQVCDSQHNGVCKDPCSGTSCPANTMCRAGTCVDCFTLGCPEGMTCVEGPNSTGICMSNPCMNVNCPQGQSCNPSNGMCQTVACAPACDVGQVCQAGTCVAACAANACNGVTCGMGEVCRPSNGQCIADPCASANCGEGGTCSVSCEGTASCVVPAGVNVFPAQWDPKLGIHVT